MGSNFSRFWNNSDPSSGFYSITFLGNKLIITKQKIQEKRNNLKRATQEKEEVQEKSKFSIFNLLDNTCFGTSNINGDLTKTNQVRIINQNRMLERLPLLNINNKPGSTLSVSIWAMGSSTSTLSPGSGYHLPRIHNKLDKKVKSKQNEHSFKRTMLKKEDEGPAYSSKMLPMCHQILIPP